MKTKTDPRLNTTHVTDGCGNLHPIATISIITPSGSGSGSEIDSHTYHDIPTARRAAIQMSNRIHSKHKSRADGSALQYGKVHVLVYRERGRDEEPAVGPSAEILYGKGKLVADTTRGDMPPGRQ